MFKSLLTVESITKPLGKMIQDLNSLTTKHNKEIEQNNAAIANLSADNAARTAEIACADAISKKLSSLLSE